MVRALASILLTSLSLPLAAADARPNVVVILVDDAGFMDFGGYGGEAKTPAIDALAERGVRFSNYHTSPLCATSRAMLLTGLSNHGAGVGTIQEVITDAQSGQPGYSLRFESGVETVATRLQRAGYRTYMTGKWHLGHEEGSLPVSHGFDRSFILDASGADNFEQKSYWPYYQTAPWFEDDAPATLPEDFYSSEFIVDKMMEYLDTAGDEPFFSYLAFLAIHIPIQAPKEFIDRYADAYTDVWHVLREQRWHRARVMGLIDEDAPLAPMHEALPKWETLSDETRRYYAKSMQVNAAMLEAMDHHIGRFIDYLRERGQFDNTLFIVASDNGPEFNEPANTRVMQFWMSLNGYTSETATLGKPGSLAHIGPAWASAASSPGRLFKFHSTEGGMRVPLIVSGPGVRSRDRFVPDPAFVTDLTPTILDAAGVAAEEGLDGISLAPLLRGESLAAAHERGFGMEVSGHVAWFRGDYKLLRAALPYGDEQWYLFDIKRDPGETRDLAESMPERFNAMKREYRDYASAVGVIGKRPANSSTPPTPRS